MSTSNIFLVEHWFIRQCGEVDNAEHVFDGKIIYSDQYGDPDNSVGAAMARLKSVGYNFLPNKRGDYFISHVCGAANPSAAGNNSEALIC
jgi:hypothetical protein